MSSFTSSAAPTYQLRNKDKLKLVVFGQEAISGDYTITNDGFIEVTELGRLQAAGLGVNQLEQQIIEKLRVNGVENPQVSVLLDVDSPVFVTGAVLSPGQFPFQPGLDGRSAVALAGGYSDRADTRTIFVTHAGTNTEKRYRINERPVINPGDAIRIPERS